MIHRRIPYIRNLIKLSQTRDSLLTNELSRNFVALAAEDFLLDFLGQAFDLFHGDRTLVASLLNAGDDLLAVVGDSGAVLFDDSELDGVFDAFVSRETTVTCEAKTPSTHDAAAFAGAGVDDLVGILFAEWATHAVRFSLGLVRPGVMAIRAENSSSLSTRRGSWLAGAGGWPTARKDRRHLFRVS